MKLCWKMEESCQKDSSSNRWQRKKIPRLETMANSIKARYLQLKTMKLPHALAVFIHHDDSQFLYCLPMWTLIYFLAYIYIINTSNALEIYLGVLLEVVQKEQYKQLSSKICFRQIPIPLDHFLYWRHHFARTNFSSLLITSLLHLPFCLWIFLLLGPGPS